MKTAKKIKNQIKHIENCDICKHWSAMCLLYQGQSNFIDPSNYKKEMQEFYLKNEKHLLSKGFSYIGGIKEAIDFIAVKKIDALEDSLILVTIGTNEKPASHMDINNSFNYISEALKGVKNVRCLITHHAISLNKVNNF